MGAGASSPAAGQQSQSGPDEAFAIGEAAFAEGDYEAALSAFEQAREQGADGAAVHYNIGVCQYRLEEYAAAAETFRLIAERFPGMRDVADYNLGLALVEQNRTESARAAFARAERGGDETVARLAAAMLGRLGRGETAGERSMVALVDVAAGYDDNVALLDELSLPASDVPDSTLLEALGYVNMPFGESERFGFEATGYAIDYRDAAPYDQAALRAGLDYRPAAAGRRVTLGPYYERTQLGGRGFEQRVGVDVDVSTSIGERAALSFRVGVAQVEDLHARFSFVEGDQWRARVRLRHPLASGTFSARYDWEDNDRAAASVSPTRNRLTVDWRRRISARWEAGLGLRYRRSNYDELATPRTEELRELRLDLARDVARGWQVTGALRLADNDASNSVFAYERELWSAGLRKVF